jgi:hypothetical protein
MYKLYDILNLKEFEVKWPLDRLKKAVIDPNTNKPYTTTAEFKKANYNAWKSADYQNLLTTLIPNLTPEDIKKVVFDSKTNKKRFCTSDEFKKAEPKAYDSAKKLGILYDLYFDAKEVKDITPEEVKQGVIDCKTGEIYTSRNAFARGNRRVYDAARNHKMLNQLFPVKGVYNKVFIYAFKFFDKQNNPTSAYVGLSSITKTREKEHVTGINRYKRPQITSVTEYIKSHPEERYEFEALTQTPLEVSGETAEERYNSPAGKAERKWIEILKSKGWQIMNKKEGGKDFGNTPVESEEELMSQALKYKSWTDLMRAGMPPQYSNPNSFKSGLYQKIRRKDETNPGFTKKVKQAIDQKQSIAETQYFKKPATIRNKDVPSTNYYRGLLKTANITQSRVDAINNVLNNIDKNNKKATEKEYILLQALKTGNFKYSTKN